MYIFELDNYQRDVVRALDNYKKSPNNQFMKQNVLDAVGDALDHYYYVYNYEEEDEETSK